MHVNFYNYYKLLFYCFLLFKNNIYIYYKFNFILFLKIFKIFLIILKYIINNIINLNLYILLILFNKNTVIFSFLD